VPDRKNASATSTRAGILRPDQLAQHVTLERAECADALAPWVENYWSLQWDLPAGSSYLSSTLPHPACNLSVERGIRREGVGEDPVVVTGVVTKRFDVTIRDQGWVYAAKFRPGGLAALTGAHARDLRDATVTASSVFDRADTDALRDLTGMSEGKRVFDDLLGRLATDPSDDYLLLLEVIAAMLADRSLLRVAEVEERCGVGTRTLQRLFQRYVGVSPKWVLSRYRMHDVVTDLDAGYGGSLADLAAKYGWFDQAHFTREFTELVGTPPGAYVRDRADG
jgi:AraC-like DNA-binding protein